MVESEPLPGQLDQYGSAYEPMEEPDLAEYMANKSLEYGQPVDFLCPEVGFLLPDGRCLLMGRGGERGQDHRWMVPTLAAIERWGWPHAVVIAHREYSRTPAMFELMRRSGAVRVILGHDLILSLRTKPTRAQIRVVTELIRERPRLDVYVEDGRSRDAHMLLSFEVEDYLSNL